MPESTIKQRMIVLVLLLSSTVGLLTCATRTGQENEPSPVLSVPPHSTYAMPPVVASKSLGQMGWFLLDDRRLTVSDYQNKVLVLDFYATWCLACRDSIPHLVDLQKRYGLQGLSIVGLNVGGPQDRDKVPAFGHELQIRYPLGFPDQALIDLLLSDDSSIPQTFVFDRQGKLTKRFIGYSDSTANELEQAIRAALAPQPQ